VGATKERRGAPVGGGTCNREVVQIDFLCTKEGLPHSF